MLKIRTLWTIQNTSPVISSVNTLNKCKAAKSQTFPFQNFMQKYLMMNYQIF